MHPNDGNTSTSANTVPTLTLQDVQDPTEEKLNRILQFLAGQIASIQGFNGVSAFASKITAPDFFATNTGVPTDPNQLLTLAAATALFNPNQQRNSLLSGLWFGVPVSPLPSAPQPAAAGYSNLSVISGVVTPDLSKGYIQRVLLNQDVAIAAPIHAPSSAAWILIIDEDSTGNWTASLDPVAYYHSFSLISGPNTRMQVNWVLDPSGYNSINGSPSLGQPTPP